MRLNKALLKERQFQGMQKYLGMNVRNFCSGCGEEIHQPIYCEECQKQVERVRMLKQKFQ